ncbi:MAG: response regulator [Geminocystis sp.]
MNQEYPPLEILRKICQNKQTGHLQIQTNSVRWNIYLVEGKIQYAQHNLQSIETVKNYLIHLQIPFANTIGSDLRNLSKPFLLLAIVKELVEQNQINREQKNILLRKLTEDAIESFICLPEGQTKWEVNNNLSLMGAPKIFENNGIEGDQIIDSLKGKISQWQKLKPFISSPHQRPSCPNISLLSTKVSGGSLTPSVLQKLVKTMTGESLRNISFLLKQDDFKLAQVLYPYIKHRIIILDPPKSPLDKLPLIPSVSNLSSLRVRNVRGNYFTEKAENISSSSSVKSTIVSSTNTVNTVKNNLPVSSTIKPSPSIGSKTHKIICIDDSQVMLDTIKDYLGSENYDTLTVANPMQCLPSLFASKPDLILLDLSMPNINGNRLCQILRSSPTFKQVPIIIVSGNINMLTQEKIEAIGANDFLPKPFTKEELLVIVNKYLL